MKKNSNFSAIRKVINQLRPNLTDLASVHEKASFICFKSSS